MQRRPKVKVKAKAKRRIPRLECSSGLEEVVLPGGVERRVLGGLAVRVALAPEPVELLEEALVVKAPHEKHELGATLQVGSCVELLCICCIPG